MSKVNGTVVKERLESLVETAALEERTAKNSLKGAESQLAQNATKKTSQLAIMARVHLQTLRSGNTRLHPITQEVSNLMTQRQADFDALKAQLVSEQGAVEQAEVALRTASQTLESRKSQRDKEMSSHEGLKALREQVALLSVVVKEKEDLVESITQECRGKVVAYHDDPFFMHLQNIGFGTDNGTGKWLFRGLDSWLASRINYRQSAHNYKLLLDLPVKAREALQSAQDQYESLLDEIEKVVDQLEEASGMNQAEVRLEAASQRLKEREQALKSFQESVEAHEAGTDQPLKHILTVISKAMESMSLQTLDRLTSETDNREDELALSTYRALVEGETRLRGEIAAMQNRHENAAHRYKRASNLQEYCNDQGLDSSKRIYDSNFNLQSLVDGYMIGQIEQSMLGRQLESQSQVLRERAPEPSYTPATSSGYSSGYSTPSRNDDDDSYRSRSSISDSDNGYKSNDSISSSDSGYKSGDGF